MILPLPDPLAEGLRALNNARQQALAPLRPEPPDPGSVPHEDDGLQGVALHRVIKPVLFLSPYGPSKGDLALCAVRVRQGFRLGHLRHNGRHWAVMPLDWQPPTLPPAYHQAVALYVLALQDEGIEVEP